MYIHTFSAIYRGPITPCIGHPSEDPISRGPSSCQHQTPGAYDGQVVMTCSDGVRDAQRKKDGGSLSGAGIFFGGGDDMRKMPINIDLFRLFFVVLYIP